jgi:AbrB family looped-hinge helix DNA binding protein
VHTTVTTEGQITIPKHILDSVAIAPGTKVEFLINGQGRIEIVREGEPTAEKEQRFRSAIGSATVKWDTDELMALLRGED